ncbi:hypothetical protein BJ742DRAFT_855734 [Cladochytrium replicatum]|nr:hypothetical protein BJ742DRAFT_855734 [Cladochytrium replicatum]
MISEWMPKFPEPLTPAESNKKIVRSLTNQFYKSFYINLGDRIAGWAEATTKGASFDAFSEEIGIGYFVTTFFTFSSSVYHPAADKELQQRVRANIESVVPKGEEQLTQEHLSKMERWGAPPVAELKVGDIDIPKGSLIAMPLASTYFIEDNVFGAGCHVRSEKRSGI